MKQIKDNAFVLSDKELKVFIERLEIKREKQFCKDNIPLHIEKPLLKGERIVFDKFSIILVCIIKNINLVAIESPIAK